ncbi:MAG: hypothetical protein J6V26_02570 [Alistipes sp.]|nr:hypothetical protein [Alistipes sp.]
MTRKLLLFLASTLIAFQAMALEPTANGVTPQPASSSVEDSIEEDDEWSFWWEAGFDLASNYMWRGFDQSYRGGNRNMVDPSFQPALTLGYGKFYVRLWGNASLFSDYKEFDMFLGFQHEGLEVTIYDVFCGVGQDFNAPFFDKSSHNLTATIDYTFFDRLRLHWATTFLHPSDFIVKNGVERRAFSSYFEVAYTQPVKEWFDVEVIAGASPWTGPFWCPTRVGNDYDWDNPAKGFNVTNLSLTLSREFTKGNVSFPVSLGYTYNPLSNYHYALLTAGFYF